MSRGKSGHGLPILMRHWTMAAHRRQQFCDPLLISAPTHIGGIFNTPSKTLLTLSDGALPTPKKASENNESNEAKSAQFQKIRENKMTFMKNMFVTTDDFDESDASEVELLVWLGLCKTHANVNIDLQDGLTRVKIAMMRERFAQYAIGWVAQLEHPLLRSMGMSVVAQHHLQEGQALTLSDAEKRWPMLQQAETVDQAIQDLYHDQASHWRLMGWWETAVRQESDPLLERFAWLAGAQSALNMLVASLGETAPGWDVNATAVWCRLAISLGKHHRYLSDDGWNDRYVETQWRSKMKEGFVNTLGAASYQRG